MTAAAEEQWLEQSKNRNVEEQISIECVLQGKDRRKRKVGYCICKMNV